MEPDNDWQFSGRVQFAWCVDTEEFEFSQPLPKRVRRVGYSLQEQAIFGIIIHCSIRTLVQTSERAGGSRATRGL